MRKTKVMRDSEYRPNDKEFIITVSNNRLSLVAYCITSNDNQTLTIQQPISGNHGRLVALSACVDFTSIFESLPPIKTVADLS